MNKRPLQNLFSAMYHNKFAYSDFLTCRVSDNSEVSRYRDREVLKPNRKLKAYLKFLNLFLFELLPVNQRVVFSYRKGYGPYDAVAPHSQSKYFFQTDISAFFSSIDRVMVKDAIVSGKDTSSIADLDFHLERILELACIDNQLPTGFPTSPVITNSVLKVFDDNLEARCSKAGLTVSRYSDDIIVSAANTDAIYSAPNIVEKVLMDAFNGRLVLNQGKTRHFKVGGKVKILGMVILPNGQITVDAMRRSEIEVLLHFYLTNRDRFLDKVNGDLDRGEERIAGFLNYVNTVNQAYLDKLRHKYGAATVDMFLHRSFN